MDPMDVNAWIEHLNKPLVLVGFALWLLSGMSRQLLKSHKHKHNAFWAIFVLGTLVIVSSIFLAINEINTPQVINPTPTITEDLNNSDSQEGDDTAKSEGDQSPAVVQKGDGNVTINVNK